MHVLVIGAGAIGSELARAAEHLGHDVSVHDVDATAGEALAAEVGGVFVADPGDDLARFDLVLEAASGEAVVEWAVPVLSAGVDLMVLSVGAFADDELLESARSAAEANHARVLVPSGAMAGLDGVKALAMCDGATCTLTTCKPPRGLGLDVDEPKVVFEGDFRQAVAEYPKNVNVAAALALAGLAPRVRIVADPAVDRNTHTVVVETDQHRIDVRVQSDPTDDNPRTSDLAVRSAVAMLRGLDERVRVGT